jgi:hypothetical protein
MRKLIISILLTIFATMFVQAQQIKLEYENKISTLPELVQQYFEMQKVQHSRLTMKGDFNGKRAKMKKVICDKGTFIEHDLLEDYVHFIFVDSVETLDFMAIPYGKDSLRISCFYPSNYNRVIFNDTVQIDNMKILLETFTPGNSPDVPIIAYSTGIPFEGGTWYCGLRDSGIEPRKWHEKYGIDGYVFYTIRLEEDTSNDNMPIYIKIAKEGAHAIHLQ